MVRRDGIEKMDHIRMELIERDEAEIFRAEGRLEAAAVFEDVFAGSQSVKPRFRTFSPPRSETPRLGAGAVDEPGILLRAGTWRIWRPRDLR